MFSKSRVRSFDTLQALMLAATQFGWSVGQDLFIVLDHAGCILRGQPSRPHLRAFP